MIQGQKGELAMETMLLISLPRKDFDVISYCEKQNFVVWFNLKRFIDDFHNFYFNALFTQNTALFRSFTFNTCYNTIFRYELHICVILNSKEILHKKNWNQLKYMGKLGMCVIGKRIFLACFSATQHMFRMSRAYVNLYSCN